VQSKQLKEMIHSFAALRRLRLAQRQTKRASPDETPKRKQPLSEITKKKG